MYSTGLGGADTAPNPVEYILAALGSCQEITYRLYADALGIPLNGVSVELTGAIDLRGFSTSDGVYGRVTRRSRPG
jgi:putative redox protein